MRAILLRHIFVNVLLTHAAHAEMIGMAAQYNLEKPSNFEIAAIPDVDLTVGPIPPIPHLTILLGAGASKEWGMPLICDFQDETFIRETCGRQADELVGIVREDIDRTVGFEQSLREAFEHGDTRKVDKLLDLYYSLFFAAETKYGTTKPRQLPSVEYLLTFCAIVNSYCDMESNNGTRLGVNLIDLNHDILIELSTSFHGFHYGTLTYEMCMPKTHTGGIITPGLPTFSSKLALLKPHGSFNWLYCTRCFAFYCGSANLWASTFLFEPCPNCGNSKITRAYHPPSPQALQSVFVSVWQDIRKVLSRTFALIVIGYSFPVYDVLLRRTILDYLLAGCKILIVDPFAASNVKNYDFLSSPRSYISEKFSAFVARWFNHNLFLPDWGERF
jgi:hypothetical protein